MEKFRRSEKSKFHLFQIKDEIIFISNVSQICSFVAKLTANCISAEEIGIIAPYFQQVILLKKHLSQHKKLAIGTVEEFQGEEKKVIIISGTKTSGTDIGLKFVFCPKRLNTAISRAQ